MVKNRSSCNVCSQTKMTLIQLCRSVEHNEVSRTKSPTPALNRDHHVQACLQTDYQLLFVSLRVDHLAVATGTGLEYPITEIVCQALCLRAIISKYFRSEN